MDDCFCSPISPLFDSFKSLDSPFIYLIQVASQSSLSFGLLVFAILNVHTVVEIGSLMCFCLFLPFLHFHRNGLKYYGSE